MKKLFFLTMLVLVYSQANCQIGTTSVKVQKAEKEIIIFDSTRNYYKGMNMQSFSGQVLFVLPDKGDDEYGYSEFKVGNYNPQSDRFSDDTKRYGNPAPKSSYNTRKEDLAGKYFMVDSVLEHERYGSTGVYLYLTNTKNPSDKCCYMLGADFEFPFLAVSHFNHLKSRYVGNKYVIRERPPFMKMRDIISGDTIIIKEPSGSIWEVIDITILEETPQWLVVILKRGNETTYFNAEWFERFESMGLYGRIVEKSMWDMYVKEYGLSMVTKAFKGDVIVGMPLQLLKDAFGSPDKINRSSHGDDQYVYRNFYAYVRNGKIVSWQSR